MGNPDLPRNALVAAMLALAPTTAGAAADAIDTDIVIAPETYRECVVCHGVELMGNRAVDAPKLAGLPDWYIGRQMQAFREGWRGSHPGDATGMEMQPQARVLSPAEVAGAVAWAASVPAHSSPATITGDVDRGARLYEPCAACHGTQGEGNRALLSPPLAGQSDWYLVTQIEHFRSGVRGAASGDTQGAIMRAAALTLPDDQAMTDVIAYVNTFSAETQSSEEGETAMKKTAAAAALAATLGAAGATADVTRYPLPNSDFPIAQAVEIPAGTTIVYHSGMTPRPADPDATRYTREFWGNTETQAMSVFSRLEESLTAKNLGFGDVVKMQVYLVGVPELNGAMDFDGFMNAYRKYFGSDAQPNLPARSAFQVAGLAAPGMLVEVEVVLARPSE
ncbi:MAG: c-type cytochrome [Pseudomonadales bacterium]